MPAAELRLFVLLTAAGSSSRFRGEKKEFIELDGKPVLLRALEKFLILPGLAGIVITFPPGLLAETEKSLGSGLLQSLKDSLPGGIQFVPGGDTRQASVKAGLERLSSLCANLGIPADDATVLIHDGARPWVSEPLIRSVQASAETHGASIPLCELSDTPKLIGADHFIAGHPERSSLRAAQTPQGFRLGPLLEAHRKAEQEGFPATDDSLLWEKYCGPVAYVEGERANRKITYREDLPAPAPALLAGIRIGEGWDIHALAVGRRLLLAGVCLDFERGEQGHSDGDVLWHAIMDALLGAMALGDIGTHFPPSDATWKDADSTSLARLVRGMLFEGGWEIVNLDCTVILERPRIGPYRDAIRESIAGVLGIDRDIISLKAKTNEGFGEIGRSEAVEARAVVLLARRSRY